MNIKQLLNKKNCHLSESSPVSSEWENSHLLCFEIQLQIYRSETVAPALQWIGSWQLFTSTANSTANVFDKLFSSWGNVYSSSTKLLSFSK